MTRGAKQPPKQKRSWVSSLLALALTAVVLVAWYEELVHLLTVEPRIAAALTFALLIGATLFALTCVRFHTQIQCVWRKGKRALATLLQHTALSIENAMDAYSQWAIELGPLGDMIFYLSLIAPLVSILLIGLWVFTRLIADLMTVGVPLPLALAMGCLFVLIPEFIAYYIKSRRRRKL